MRVIALTQKGPTKFENEDRIVVGRSVISDGICIDEMGCGVIAVADGVGGNKAGAVASDFVSKRLLGATKVDAALFESINTELIFESIAREGCNGMATTLSGVCIYGGKASLFSIGNTRVYLLQGKRYLKQLTSDDTTLNFLVSTGRLSPSDADTFERKNEITTCFGGGNPSLFNIKLEKIEIPVAPILITSDGIHDHLSVDEMEAVIEEQGLTESACIELISAARKNGSLDDASVILANF